MKIAVLGSGTLGVATAWWLHQDGHEVLVIDRQPGPALECSRANGGQISVSYAEPWANPKAPWRLARWLFKDDAPLWFKPSLDPKQWMWGLRFLWECQPKRFEPNVKALLRLAEYSRTVLQEMRQSVNVEYHCLEKGILSFYRDERSFDEAQEMADVMRNFGIDRRILSADELVALVPALTGIKHQIAGGDFHPEDESGDAYEWTTQLAAQLASKGVEFQYSTQVTRLCAEQGQVQHLEIVDAEGDYQHVPVDAVVVALGAHSAALLSPLGISCPVYPAKGYSASFDIKDASAIPDTSLTDSARKMAYTRLGNTLRMAGTAELSGYSRALNGKRCLAMVKQAQELFPNALDFDNVQFWSGLRPATPSNVPLIGRTEVRNLYLNTGHGTLGWTLGAGSGKALADLIAGRQPEAEFPFLR